MSRLSWKMLGLVALVAGGIQLATMGGAGALTLPMPTMPSVSENGQWNGQLVEVAKKKKYTKKKAHKQKYKNKKFQKKKINKQKYHGKKKYNGKKKYYGKKKFHNKSKHYGKHYRWNYNRHRHGHRYKHKRRGYGYFYGGYWYARPWWTLTVQPVIPLVYSPHVRWCLRHYPNSYDVDTNLYLGYDGYYHSCRSPFGP